ncbi:MAG: hypothetical protein HQK51_06450, partial [Oligoflexia bacterium]|nr:hypothetical protein [Oligoflexia bacterium]
ENAGTVEFLNAADVKSAKIDITKANKLTISSDSKLQGDSVEIKSDYAKIEGALNSLGALTYNGTEFHLEGSGVITGKGDISIVGDLVEIKARSKIEGESKVSITAKNEINIDGTIKSADALTINAKKDLILANNSNIHGNFVSIIAGAKISTDGEITSDKNIEFKLDGDNGKNIRGHLKANGWVVVDGTIDTESLVSLIVDRKDLIEAQGIGVITTEPIIIQKNIELKYGLALSASNIKLDKNTSIDASEVTLNTTEGDVTLESGSKITAQKNVKIFAKGDIVRNGEELSDSDKNVAISSIKVAEGDIVFSTDGSYKEVAAETRTTGKLIILTKKGIVITPIKQVFVTETIDKKWYGKKVTTTTSVSYKNSQMESSELFLGSGEGNMDITNLVYNNKKLTLNDYDLEKVKLQFLDGQLSLKQIENSVTTTVNKSYNAFIKPLATTYQSAKDINEAGKKLTHNILKAGEKVLREISKPITKNISGSEKYIDLIANLANSSADFSWNVTNVEKFYKVDTYKEQYNNIKTVAIEVIKDASYLEKKFANKLNKEVIFKISHDIANIIDNTIKIQDKGVAYVDAVTSFENVTRVALVSLASQLAGPAGSALANVISDKYISKKEMSSSEILKSLSIGLAAGYAAEHVSEITKEGFKNFASSLASNGIVDVGNIVLDDRAYSSADLMAMILRSATSGVSSSNPFVNGTLSAGSNQIINGAVIDHKVNLQDVGDAALNGAINGKVSDVISKEVKTYITQNLPGEYQKRWDIYIAAEMSDRFKKAVDALARNLESNLSKEEDNDNNNGESEKVEESEKAEKTKLRVDSIEAVESVESTVKPTYIGSEFNPSSYDLDSELLEKWKIKFNVDTDTELNIYEPSLLDNYGFIKDLSLGNEQRKFISEEMSAYLPKESQRLKMQLNSWDFKNLSNKQIEIINQVDQIKNAYSDIKNIPIVYDDRIDLLNIENIIFFQSYAHTVTASTLSKDDTYQAAYEEYMKKGKQLLDSGLDIYQAHESDDDPFNIEFHKGYYRGLLEGAKNSTKGFVDFIIQSKEDWKKFSTSVAWAIENPQEAAKVYKANIVIKMFKYISAKPEEQGKLVGEFAGSAGVDYITSEAAATAIKVVKNTEFADRIYRGLVRQTSNEIGAVGLEGIGSTGVKAVPKAEIVTVDPSKIKFSQSSVNDVAEVVESMKLSGWRGDPIDIVRLKDGSLISVDNTRVLAASRANINVKAKIHEANEILPDDPILALRFKTKDGIVPKTWGEALENRIRDQNKIFRETYPNGSPFTGTKE